MSSSADTTPDNGADAEVTRRHVLNTIRIAMGSTPIGLVLIDLEVENENGELVETNHEMRIEMQDRVANNLAESDELLTADLDRLLVIKPRLGAPAEAEGFALRLVKALAGPLRDNPNNRTCRSTIGVAVSHARDDAEDLLRYVEHAIADAHLLGGGRVVCFEDADRELLP